MTTFASPCFLNRNQADTFLLKKHKNLGDLLRVKVGHDNSGIGPGGWGPLV